MGSTVMAKELSDAEVFGHKAEMSDADVFSAPTEKQQSIASIPSRIIRGMKDPLDAGAQLLTHILPDSVVDAGNTANNWLADKTGLVSRLPERNLSGLITGQKGGIDQALSDQEKEYQAARTATGNTGVDWARLGGNVASPVNLILAARVPQAATAAGRIGTAAATGGAFGALSPVTEGNFATEKAKQIGIGAALGPAAQLGGEALARIIKPNTAQSVKDLMSEGITPTPGQILGGRWQVLEDKLTSVPILGDAIASARGKGIDELNVAAYKRALEPLDVPVQTPLGPAQNSVKPYKVPTTAGREAVASVRQQIGDAYDKLLPKVQFKADNDFATDIQNLQSMAANLPPEQAARFERVLKNQVIGKMTPQGSMDGQTLKGIESDIGSLATGLKSDSAFDNRQLGAALDEVRAAIRSNLERANPQYADELKAANTAWANYTRIRDAASRQGAGEGKFTPAQLSAAVRAGDKSKGKRAFSEGDALMQDLSDPAKEVLASKYPDSGTAGRTLAGLLTGAGAVGGTAAAPGIGLPALAGAGLGIAPYLPGGRQAAAALLARRPDFAEPVANAVRRIAPAGSAALLGLFKP